MNQNNDFDQNNKDSIFNKLIMIKSDISMYIIGCKNRETRSDLIQSISFQSNQQHRAINQCSWLEIMQINAILSEYVQLFTGK